MAVTIVLEPYGQTFLLPREFIEKDLPGSLFAEALEVDPMADTLPIPNPIVTPVVMQFLVDYSQGIEPIKHIPDLDAASRYLNIHWMLYYAEPLYDKIQRPIDTLWTVDDWEEPTEDKEKRLNWTVFADAVAEERPLVIEYLHKKGFDLGGAYLYAREYNYAAGKDMLLHLMIPMYEAHRPIIDAVMNNHLPAVQRLAQNQEALEAAAIVAAYECKNDILRWILKTTPVLSPLTRHLISEGLAAFSQYYRRSEDGYMAGQYLDWLVQNRFL